VPCPIVRFDGLNARFIMHTCVEVGMHALPPPPPPYVGELPLQPSNAENVAMTRTTRFRIERLDQKQARQESLARSLTS